MAFWDHNTTPWSRHPSQAHHASLHSKLKDLVYEPADHNAHTSSVCPCRTILVMVSQHYSHKWCLCAASPVLLMTASARNVCMPGSNTICSRERIPQHHRPGHWQQLRVATSEIEHHGGFVQIATDAFQKLATSSEVGSPGAECVTALDRMREG